MKINKTPCIARWTILVAVLLTVCNAYDPDAESINVDRHSNKPRFLRIYSRPHPDAEKQVGVGLKQHFRNVLNGGTIGLHTEFRPLAPIAGLLNHAKKMIPNPDIHGVFDGKGKIFPGKEIPNLPDNDKPVWRPEKPSGDKPEEPNVDIPAWEPEKPKKPDRADMESEEPDWEHRDPKKPRNDGPQWEDIGEGNDGEGIIQPRLHRPKRFVDSHVYHVPLEFVSNAKPYGIKVRHPNQP